MCFPARFSRCAALAATSLCALTFATVTPQTARAQTIQATDRGFYDSTGFHDPTNLNISVGQRAPLQFRNWFVFNIPALAAGQTYTSATLQLQLTTSIAAFRGTLAGEYTSVDATETYDLRDVSTPIASLVAGGSGMTAIYNDLGTGTSYATRVFSAADNDTTVNMTLNLAGLANVNAVAGGQFALAGFVSTLSGNGDQFVSLGSDTTSTSGSNLVLTSTAAPEPGTLPLLGMGLVSGSSGAVARGAVRRRRKRQ